MSQDAVRSATQVVLVDGELDLMTVVALQRQIAQRGDDARRGGVTVDLGAVTVRGTHGVSLLCGALRRLTREGARITVVGATPYLRKALELCQVHGLELGPATSDQPHPLAGRGEPAHARHQERMREHA